MIVLGIDPGLDGAACRLAPDGGVDLYDMPTLTIAGGKSNQRELAIADIRGWLHGASCDGRTIAYLESVHAMPGQGVRSMFTMGHGLGVWEGLLAGMEIPYVKVTPQRWKKALMDGMGKDKDAARLVALRRYPQLAGHLTRKKDHGRADALLIATYGAQAALGPPEAR